LKQNTTTLSAATTYIPLVPLKKKKKKKKSGRARPEYGKSCKWAEFYNPTFQPRENEGIIEDDQEDHEEEYADDLCELAKQDPESLPSCILSKDNRKVHSCIKYYMEYILRSTYTSDVQHPNWY
jgi:hypothetical protein